MAQAFLNLDVWRRAIELTVSVYKLTRSFPKDELYGLASQMRRASVSIASNVAEGRARATHREFRQFLSMALGSTFELRTQLEVAKELEMGDHNALCGAQSLAEEVSKMLSSLIQTLGTSKRLKAEI